MSLSGKPVAVFGLGDSVSCMPRAPTTHQYLCPQQYDCTCLNASARLQLRAGCSTTSHEPCTHADYPITGKEGMTHILCVLQTQTTSVMLLRRCVPQPFSSSVCRDLLVSIVSDCSCPAAQAPCHYVNIRAIVQ